jgi:hypothetical protein
MTRFPPGWDEERVQRLLAELDSWTEEDWVVADEASHRARVREVAAEMAKIHRDTLEKLAD